MGTFSISTLNDKGAWGGYLSEIFALFHRMSSSPKHLKSGLLYYISSLLFWKYNSFIFHDHPRNLNLHNVMAKTLTITSLPIL